MSVVMLLGRFRRACPQSTRRAAGFGGEVVENVVDDAVAGHWFGARAVVVTSGKRPEASTVRMLSMTCWGVA